MYGLYVEFVKCVAQTVTLAAVAFGFKSNKFLHFHFHGLKMLFSLDTLLSKKRKKNCFHGVEFVVHSPLSHSVVVCCICICNSLGGSKSKLKKAKSILNRNKKKMAFR